MQEVKRIRNERGLTQQQLCDLAGVNRVTLIRIEHGTGNPNVETLEKLACALDVEVGDFFPKAQAPLPLDWDVDPARGIQSDGLYKVDQPAWEESVEPGLFSLQNPKWRAVVGDQRLMQIRDDYVSGKKSEDEAIEAVASEIASHFEDTEAPEKVLDE